MSAEDQDGTIRLEPMDERAAAEVGARTIDPPGPAILGRAGGCAISFEDLSVSRRHASLIRRDEQWYVVDLGGRHGTYLNGVRLEAERPAAAAQGDFVRIGPYTFRITFRRAKSGTIARTVPAVTPDTVVERVSGRDMSLAQRRLEVLIDGAVAINQAPDEETLAEALVGLAVDGTGFPRAALLRPAGTIDQVEVLAVRDQKASRSEFSFSSTLIREASGGHIARISRRGGAQVGQSIERLGITGALCAPIVLDASVVGYIYLDSREKEQAGFADAAGFCHAVSKMAGLALSNLKRAELQKRQRRLEDDLNGARNVQSVLCPRGRGEVGPLRYAVQNRPGRFVAGDLFDIFALDGGRVGFCFGDVTGQGATAAILMTAVLAHMRASLARYGDPARATDDVNRYIAERSPEHMFASLWVGVYAAGEGLRYVDGGHGHWFLARRGAAPETPERPGDLLVGIDAAYRYTAHALPLAPGDRIILYSDGVIEQADPDGQAFEKPRVREVLAGTSSADEDVKALFDRIEEFAGKTLLDDDTTVASIEVA
jgi:serine phosphatase RsbU (regulator of sigma subunit)